MADAPLTRLLEITREVPEVETEGDRHVGFSVRGRRFAWCMDDHHGDGLALSCKAPPGVNEGFAAPDPALLHPLVPGLEGLGRGVAGRERFRTRRTTWRT